MRGFSGVLVLVCLVGCHRQSETADDRLTPDIDGVSIVPQKTIDVEVLKIFKPSLIIVRGAQEVRQLDVDDELIEQPRSEIQAVDGGVMLDGVFVRDGLTVTPLESRLTISVHVDSATDARTSRIERTYEGTLRVRSVKGVLRLIITMDFESYVAGVLAAELPSGPRESRRAQSIVIRTYGLHRDGRHTLSDVCDLTHCQVFKDRADSKDIEVVRSTQGLVLSAHGELAHGFYSSTCGGRTADYLEVWPGVASMHGPTSVVDVSSDGRSWCESSPHFHWRFDLSRRELFEILKKTFPSVKPNFRMTLSRAESGWVNQVHITGVRRFLTGEEFHLILGRTLGWNTMKSAQFQIEESAEGVFQFAGKGLGHGVGLCQHGAIAQAKAGRSALEILRHYFPKFEVTRWD